MYLCNKSKKYVMQLQPQQGPQQQQGVNVHLLVYTREYCTKQLTRALREPLTNYFKFLWACAEDDAEKDRRKGKKKRLVKFQERVKAIQSYDQPKLRMLADAFQEQNEFPLNALVKTILLSTAIVVGSFSQDSLQKRDMVIPSDTQFIHAVLRNAGRTYFMDPECALRLDGNSKSYDIVADAVERTLEELIPLEALVGPVLASSNFGTHKQDVPPQQNARAFVNDMIQNADRIATTREMQDAIARHSQGSANPRDIRTPIDNIGPLFGKGGGRWPDFGSGRNQSMRNDPKDFRSGGGNDSDSYDDSDSA